METPIPTPGSEPLYTAQAARDPLSKLCAVIEARLQEGEAFVRRDPVPTVIYSIIAGYLLRFFPFRLFVRIIFNLVIAAIRPLIIVSGLVSIYEYLRGPAKSGLK